MILWSTALEYPTKEVSINILPVCKFGCACVQSFTILFFYLYLLQHIKPYSGWAFLRLGANRSPLPKICHLYPVMMKSGTVRLKPNEIPKNLRITWHTSSNLLISAFFHWKLANFAISTEADVDFILIHNL